MRGICSRFTRYKNKYFFVKESRDEIALAAYSPTGGIILNCASHEERGTVLT